MKSINQILQEKGKPDYVIYDHISYSWDQVNVLDGDKEVFEETLNGFYTNLCSRDFMSVRFILVYVPEDENLPGNLKIPPDKWLKKLFEHEYCSVCGGDSEHHTAVPFNGNWFARCDYPMSENGQVHPVIKAFKEKINKNTNL